MSKNPFSEQLPLGTRVCWRREVYRQRFENRPIDHGVVIDHVGPRGDFIRVLADNGQTITGVAGAFHKEA